MTPAAGRHLARTEYVVRRPDRNVRHMGHFRDRRRADHWARQAPAAGCCDGQHEVVAVPPTSRKWSWV